MTYAHFRTGSWRLARRLVLATCSGGVPSAKRRVSAVCPSNRKPLPRRSTTTVRWQRLRMQRRGFVPPRLRSSGHRCRRRRIGSAFILRTYIERLRDEALPLQRQMHTALPGTNVQALDSSHSPILSMPAQLAARLGALYPHLLNSLHHRHADERRPVRTYIRTIQRLRWRAESEAGL